MKCEFFEELKSNINLLLKKASMITMPPFMPLKYHENDFKIIQETIKKCITQTEEKISKHKERNDRKYDEIVQLTKVIGLQLISFKKSDNLLIEEEILQTHLQELKFVYEEKKFKSEILEQEVNKIAKEIGENEFTNMTYSNLTYKIDFLENKLQSLRKKKIELEKNKIIKMNEISNLIKILEKEELDDIEKRILNCDELKLHEIEEKHRELIKEYKNRSEKIKNLQLQIIKIKKYFEDLDLKNENLYEKNVCDVSFYSLNDTLIQNDDYDFSESLNLKNIEKAESVLQDLTEKKKSLFNVIFKKKSEELEEINKIFKMPIIKYEENEENLEKIESQIQDLIPKKDTFLVILDLIEKREKLKTAMIEFEKIASDPRRLFKNSKQLLNEEKFRKTAAPNLLNLEKEILNRIENYESEFGTFFLNGNYKEILTEEIRNRIINKSIFIMGGFDSPRKKRK